ncbi:uncharacterized protein BDZ83DRAFT_344596 [Colletotrichum acutatum]|uniref:Uncharacterized protein n=1 Tax=Glomerella acutata TaxID=27357 RepID=A0AAD8XP78_GLOAC|nr:uncharacterized protein BDZ83DRAFT_344596 [Colletotrichum acutatum]KAK1730911.1 hypothetical protein BDZ83DRAFT_344596 [Colletotrichum acutatum]
MEYGQDVTIQSPSLGLLSTLFTFMSVLTLSHFAECGDRRTRCHHKARRQARSHTTTITTTSIILSLLSASGTVSAVIRHLASQGGGWYQKVVGPEYMVPYPGPEAIPLSDRYRDIHLSPRGLCGEQAPFRVKPWQV